MPRTLAEFACLSLTVIALVTIVWISLLLYSLSSKAVPAAEMRVRDKSLAILSILLSSLWLLLLILTRISSITIHL